MTPDEELNPNVHVEPAFPVSQKVTAPPPQQQARGRGSGLVATIAAVLGGILGAVLVGALIAVIWGMPVKSTTSGTPGPVVTTTAPTQITVSGEGITYAEAVAIKMTPSVVSIAIEQTVTDPATGKSAPQVAGICSGVIIRADGYILTNNHVVEGADALVVTIGVDQLPAKVVGQDPSSDLAVIKVDRTGLPAAELGKSADLKVGQPVVAIGSPFGFDRSVTSGIVSALGRTSFSQITQSAVTAYTSLIQTDAAINPGNSGGALADAKGRVVGINTLIESPAGQVGASQSAGIGFAIPIDYAKSIADELISTGKATHPLLGVSTATITPAIAQQYNLSVDSGAFVQ